ncbi:hypothetical protein COE15_14000 [Bacillus cereus]|nr:hypothetical protein CN288_07955 [Bacillus sp. AFS023182]PGY00431.1 hypothetical protein COE15_14000 [Bacillus cereus]
MTVYNLHDILITVADAKQQEAKKKLKNLVDIEIQRC